MKLKLAISPCPNDTFMFHALINGITDTFGIDYDVSFADIEELNKGVLSQNPNISKISYALLPQVYGHYALLRSGSALGTGNGPLLVAKQPLDFNNKQHKIAIPGEHTTACLLMKRLFPDQTDLHPVLFSEIAERVEDGEFDAGVLIHEGRFTYHEKELVLIQDLGLLWENSRKLPLPLGAIVASRKLETSIISKVEKSIAASVEYALNHPEASRSFVKSYAQELSDEVIDNHISLFVNQYSISLDGTGIKAVTELTGLEGFDIFD